MRCISHAHGAGLFLDGWRVTDQIAEDDERDNFDFVHLVGDLACECCVRNGLPASLNMLSSVDAGTGSTIAWQPIWDAFGDQIEKIAAIKPFMASVGMSMAACKKIQQIRGVFVDLAQATTNITTISQPTSIAFSFRGHNRVATAICGTGRCGASVPLLSP